MNRRIRDEGVEERRGFLLTAASASGLALGCASASSSASAAHGRMESDEREAEVTPGGIGDLSMFTA
jgi:hypothetical protein